MANSFYVDINALEKYSAFLNSVVRKLNEDLDVLKKTTRQFRALQNDDVSENAEAAVNQLIKIFEKFNLEIEKMDKVVKEDYELYQRYLKTFN